MKHRAIALVLGCALAACSGNFASGGTEEPGGGLTPQMNNQNMMSPGPEDQQSSSRHGEGAGTPPPGDTATYPFSQAASGLQCPQVDGYTCVLRFNVPPASPSPSPTPSHGKHVKAHASPSPSPSADPSASPAASPDASASPESSASPSGSTSPAASASPAGPQITLGLEATPNDAPAMVNPDPKALAATALLAVRMSVDADVAIQGDASADFTLPSAQIGGRGFAIELFQETTGRRNKHDDHFVASFAHSTLNGDTLHFAFSPPPIAVKKDETWLLVLYGDERPDLTPSPAPSESPGSQSSPGASPSVEPTGDVSPQASSSPQ